MACEELEANFDNMMAAYDLAVSFRQTAEAELQQAQWAESAAMGAAMMAWWLLEMCLNGSGQRAAMQEMQEAFSHPEKLKAKISELQELRLKRKK
jgi:hypothetical protein